MHASECLLLETPTEVRVAGLLEDYRHYLANPETLIAHLQSLHSFHGAKQLEHWNSLIRAGGFAALVSELLTQHYDPSYFCATTGNYPQLKTAGHLQLNDLSRAALNDIARNL